MIVYLAGAIQAFVMYCVNGTSCSSLLIESTDSMIESTDSMIIVKSNNVQLKLKQKNGAMSNIMGLGLDKLCSKFYLLLFSFMLKMSTYYSFYNPYYSLLFLYFDFKLF